MSSGTPSVTRWEPSRSFVMKHQFHEGDGEPSVRVNVYAAARSLLVAPSVSSSSVVMRRRQIRGAP
eukprot:3752592-Lingulodinium_polyedra.AAC.1